MISVQLGVVCVQLHVVSAQLGVVSAQLGMVSVQQVHIHNHSPHHHYNCFTALFREYVGELVPERTSGLYGARED